MEDILRSIGSISRELDSIANIEFKELNLTKGKYLYLVRICENPGIIQGELAEKIRVDRTTAARAVMKLERMDLLHVELIGTIIRLNVYIPLNKVRQYIQRLNAKIAIRVEWR
jgi:predicted transcriptional regulator